MMVLLLVLLGCAPKAPAPEPTPAPQPPPPEVVLGAASTPQMLRAAANAAYLAGDVERFVQLQERLVAASPHGAVDRHNLACGYALTDRPEDAVRQLGWLVDQGVDLGMQADPDLESLRDREDFQALIDKLEALYPPVHTSTVLARIEVDDLAPEGLAVDEATGRIFVGSMRKGSIHVLTETEPARQFGRIVHEDAPLAALGMKVDAERGRLWVAASAFEVLEDFDPARAGLAGVFGLDLETGEIVESYTIRGAFFNDVALAPDGTLYLSGGPLFRVRPGLDSMPLPVLMGDPLADSNGIVVSPDGQTLYVGTVPGILRLDTTTWTGGLLESPASLRSFDGLYLGEGYLAGIQFTGGPWQAVKLVLDDSGSRVTEVVALERKNPEIAFAYTGALSDGRLIYVAKGHPPADAPPPLRGVLGETLVMAAPVE